MDYFDNGSNCSQTTYSDNSMDVVGNLKAPNDDTVMQKTTATKTKDSFMNGNDSSSLEKNKLVSIGDPRSNVADHIVFDYQDFNTKNLPINSFLEYLKRKFKDITFFSTKASKYLCKVDLVSFLHFFSKEVVLNPILELIELKATETIHRQVQMTDSMDLKFDKLIRLISERLNKQECKTSQQHVHNKQESIIPLSATTKKKTLKRKHEMDTQETFANNAVQNVSTNSVNDISTNKSHDETINEKRKKLIPPQATNDVKKQNIALLRINDDSWYIIKRKKENFKDGVKKAYEKHKGSIEVQQWQNVLAPKNLGKAIVDIIQDLNYEARNNILKCTDTSNAKQLSSHIVKVINDLTIK